MRGTSSVRVRDQILKIGPVAQTKFPSSTPGATSCKKTQSFVRFLPSKHHLDAAVTLRSAVTALQSQKNYLDQGCKHEAAITVRSARLISTLQWRTRPGSNPRSGPSHRQGSPHQRREPLLCEKAQALVRFLTSKHHLDAAIPRRSAIIAALQIEKSSTSTKATNIHMKQACQCDLHT